MGFLDPGGGYGRRCGFLCFSGSKNSAEQLHVNVTEDNFKL
jgi:hypothetical protein